MPFKINTKIGFAVCAAVSSFFATNAMAAATIDFTGYFSVSNWTENLTPVANNDGSVDVTGAPTIIVLNGSNDGSGSAAEVAFSIVSPEDGEFVFDWSYASTDVEAVWDDFGYTVDGVFTDLTTVSNAVNQSGSQIVPVAAGQVFAFSQRTEDNQFGGANTTITNFVFVPEPSSVMLSAFSVFFLLRRRSR